MIAADGKKIKKKQPALSVSRYRSSKGMWIYRYLFMGEVPHPYKEKSYTLFYRHVKLVFLLCKSIPIINEHWVLDYFLSVRETRIFVNEK